MDQLDREIDMLDKQLENGEITSAEYHKEYNLLMREHRDAAEDAAQGAYESEMNRWYG